MSEAVELSMGLSVGEDLGDGVGEGVGEGVGQGVEIVRSSVGSEVMPKSPQRDEPMSAWHVPVVESTTQSPSEVQIFSMPLQELETSPSQITALEGMTILRRDKKMTATFLVGVGIVPLNHGLSFCFLFNTWFDDDHQNVRWCCSIVS